MRGVLPAAGGGVARASTLRRNRCLATALQFESECLTENECCAQTGRPKSDGSVFTAVLDADASVTRHPTTSSAQVHRRGAEIDQGIEPDRPPPDARHSIQVIGRDEFLLLRGVQRSLGTMRRETGQSRLRPNLWVNAVAWHCFAASLHLTLYPCAFTVLVSRCFAWDRDCTKKILASRRPTPGEREIKGSAC